MVLTPSSNPEIYKACRQRNDSRSLKDKNVVVVGGTGGIGLAIAARFASLGANIIIVGRNQGVTTSLVPAQDAQKTFVTCDASLQANVRKAVVEIRAIPSVVASGIHHLILVCGKTITQHALTSEGRETGMAIVFWARMLFTQLLMSELARGDGVVMDVHGGGQDAKDDKGIDVDDLDLHKISYSFLNQSRVTRIATDGMYTEFARRNPALNIRFIHSFPGMIKTAGYDDCPFALRTFFRLFGGFLWTASAEDMANVMVDVCLGHPRPTTGSTFEVWNNLGKEGLAAGWIRADPDAAKRVYEAAATLVPDFPISI
ncbi:hypothetical protein HKX48_004083 [Thoreauomyces humboldtii]|nr:hypothetical protein HKX48_004083 [Thoreauomyces humboldtii]